ncbi:rhamnogalacturonan acetylesterase [Paenibacillus sp. 1781tsa1]|uniref:rhamnogalacturonan acetylesterase n=1 Tax=Paenibacillus sp. 1781tsa1 TaxID=2953810 RepID=UPI00209DFCE8|nr:rhamnogalacturonan acetylesterase [Paenibacillus sp. 1781tsa1]MCP1182070.1 rhamnogalacturonan acetylesterase [Paenibacillus sp. 1781tsa1]
MNKAQDSQAVAMEAAAEGQAVSVTRWKFNFGPDSGRADETGDYLKVTATTAYEERGGYGFEAGSLVYEKQRIGDDDVPNSTNQHHNHPGQTTMSARLRSGFCIPLKASFIVDVPDGTYQVLLVAGDELAETVTRVKAGEGRLVLPTIRALPGQFAEVRFSVVVRGGRLRLSFSGPAPRINALEITLANQTMTVFLAGDSTVTDQPESGYPYCGWGQLLPAQFKHDVAVDNHAQSGRSSRSFINEGRLSAILERIKPEDFLFIQFGHNDEKPDPERGTDPFTTYKEYLKKYIDAAREAKARPVLITPVHRRYFADDGTLTDTHGDYIIAVRELAEEEGVPLIDLAERSRLLFEQAGVEATKDDFMWVLPGEYVNFPSGVEDNTHFQERGARRLAQQVAEAIRELQLQPLQMYLR